MDLVKDTTSLTCKVAARTSPATNAVGVTINLLTVKSLTSPKRSWQRSRTTTLFPSYLICMLLASLVVKKGIMQTFALREITNLLRKETECLAKTVSKEEVVEEWVMRTISTTWSKLCRTSRLAWVIIPLSKCRENTLNTLTKGKTAIKPLKYMGNLIQPMVLA